MVGEMLKLVIVDDEYLVRNLLKNCIQWNEIGIEIAGEAESAQEALALVECVKPDLMFIDINMPMMNGIELSRVVAEQHPHTKIIVITGYEEFEYAKSGIKIGIADFLTKPIIPAEIRQSVLRVKEKIDLERNNKKELEKIRKQLEESMPYAKDSFLNELVQSSLDREKADHKLKYFGIEFKSSNFQVAVADIEHIGLAAVDEENNQLLKLQCMNLVKKILKDILYVHAFFDSSRRIVLLNSDHEIDLADYCESIKAMFIHSLKCYAVFGVGNFHQGLKKIHSSYREACEAVRYKIVVGKNQVISYNEVNDKRNEKELDMIDSVQRYLHENLSDNELSLRKVGNIFYINQSYLSRLYKQKTGVNFVEYLTRLRVQKAIELLKDQGMKVYQIAEKVGVLDPHYLGVCFKKMTGMSMSEYKRKLDREG